MDPWAVLYSDWGISLIGDEVSRRSGGPEDQHPLHRALVDWCAKHGIEDWEDMPVPQGYIVYDEERRQLQYVVWRRSPDGKGFMVTDDGEIVIDSRAIQLESPPLPWPPEVVEYGRKIF